MIRYLTLLGCVLALGVAAPMGFDAHAKKPNKMCKATALDGKQTKWKCKGSEKCCYEVVTNKGKCVPANAICL